MRLIQTTLLLGLACLAASSTNTPTKAVRDCMKADNDGLKVQCLGNQLAQGLLREREVGVKIASIMEDWDSGTTTYSLAVDWGNRAGLRAGYGKWVHFKEEVRIPLTSMYAEEIFMTGMPGNGNELVYLEEGFERELPHYNRMTDSGGHEETKRVFQVGSGSFGRRTTADSCRHLKALLDDLPKEGSRAYVIASGDWCPSIAQSYNVRIGSGFVATYGSYTFLEFNWMITPTTTYGNVPESYQNFW